MGEKKDNNLALITLVAIVAIVAIVVLFMSMKGRTVAMPATSLEPEVQQAMPVEDDNLAGNWPRIDPHYICDSIAYESHRQRADGNTERADELLDWYWEKCDDPETGDRRFR